MPKHLADIFMTAKTDEACDKHPSRHITGVRVLTSNEYVEMMREKDRKEKEAAEQMQKRKEERVEEKGEGKRTHEKEKRRREETEKRERKEVSVQNLTWVRHENETSTSLIRLNLSRGSVVLWVDCDGCGEL